MIAQGYVRLQPSNIVFLIIQQFIVYRKRADKTEISSGHEIICVVYINLLMSLKGSKKFNPRSCINCTKFKTGSFLSRRKCFFLQNQISMHIRSTHASFLIYVYTLMNNQNTQIAKSDTNKKSSTTWQHETKYQNTSPQQLRRRGVHSVNGRRHISEVIIVLQTIDKRKHSCNRQTITNFF